MRMSRIVCAANMLDDGTILVGARHWDERMHQQLELYLQAKGITEEQWIKRSREHEYQGFIDQYGTFYDREEAMIIAKREGQIFRSVGYDSTELYSEHLY